MEITKLTTEINNVNSLYDLLQKNNILTKNLLSSDDIYLINYNKSTIFNNNNYAPECRGIILSKNKKRVIAYNYPKNIKNKYNDNISNFINNLYPNDNKIIVSECIEGSQIMVYFHDNTWNISTRNKILAKESKWNSNNSFHDIYYKIISQLYNIEHYENKILNKNYCYTFIIQNVEGEKILKINNDKLYHLLTRDMASDNYDIVEHEIGIEKINRIEFDKQSLIDELSCNTNIVSQGFYDEKRNIKMYYHRYLYLNNLYGNLSNKVYKYLELYRNNNDNMELFLLYFPKYSDIFLNYDKLMVSFKKKIHNTYFKKFISKSNYDKMFCKKIIYNMHAYYLSSNNIITTEVVEKLLKDDEWISTKELFYVFNKYIDNVENINNNEN